MPLLLSYRICLTLSTLGKIFSKQHFEIFPITYPWKFGKNPNKILGANANTNPNGIHTKINMSPPYRCVDMISSICHLLNLPREWWRLNTNWYRIISCRQVWQIGKLCSTVSCHSKQRGPVKACCIDREMSALTHFRPIKSLTQYIRRN